MTALLIWALRLFVLFVIIRAVFALVSKKHPPSGSPQQEEAPRFDAKGKKVEDADFEELKK
jgi:hypothetical protein